MILECRKLHIHCTLYISGSMKVNLLNAHFTTILHTISIKTIFPFSSLPQLMERKKSIDMHTNIATALLDKIRVREGIDCPLQSDELAVMFCRPGNWICFLTWKKN